MRPWVLLGTLGLLPRDAVHLRAVVHPDGSLAEAPLLKAKVIKHHDPAVCFMAVSKMHPFGRKLCFVGGERRDQLQAAVGLANQVGGTIRFSACGLT